MNNFSIFKYYFNILIDQFSESHQDFFLNQTMIFLGVCNMKKYLGETRLNLNCILPCDFTSNWQIENLRNSLWNYNVKDLKYHFRMGRISLWKKEVAIIANPIETYLRSVYGLDLNLVLWASRWKSPAPGISPLSIRLFFLHAYRYRIPKKEA